MCYIGGVPRITIRHVEFDNRNRHATNRATEQQITSTLLGTIEASKNRKDRAAQYIVIGTADDGTKWSIPFNYNAATQTARPITAIPA